MAGILKTARKNSSVNGISISNRKTIEKIVKRYAEQDSYKENTKFEKESFVLIQDILEEAGELEKRVEYETLVTTEFSEKY